MFKHICLGATLWLIVASGSQAAAQVPLTRESDATSAFSNLAPGNYIAQTFDEQAPRTIAIIYVEDARDSQEDHPNLRQHFARGLIPGLAQRRYKKTTSIQKVAEKLASAGLDAPARSNPTAEDACRVLAVDAVMRVRLMDRAEKERVVFKHLAVFAQATLQDCSSREIIWSYNGIIEGALGFIGARSNYVIAETMATWLAEKIPKRPRKR